MLHLALRCTVRIFNVAVIYTYIDTTPADDDCTKWVLYNNIVAHGSTAHFTAFTAVECQKACEFDPRCVLVDWSANTWCYINRNASHSHFRPPSSQRPKHYELISRCNSTSGQCFADCCSFLIAFIGSWNILETIQIRWQQIATVILTTWKRVIFQWELVCLDFFDNYNSRL